MARTQLFKSTDSRERNKVKVQYFPKKADENVNGNIVESSLKELGFKEVTLGKPGIPDVPTNALFYGDKVPIDDVKLVALTPSKSSISQARQRVGCALLFFLVNLRNCRTNYPDPSRSN